MSPTTFVTLYGPLYYKLKVCSWGVICLDPVFLNSQIRVHPMTYLWRKMPWFEWFFTGTLNKSDVAFRTDELVQHISLPVLIFHARDDAVVPFQLGEKLYKVVNRRVKVMS